MKGYTGKLYETGNTGSGTNPLVTPINGDLTIYHSDGDRPPISLAGMNITDPADMPLESNIIITFSSLPRYIYFVGSAESIDISNVTLVESEIQF